MNYRYVFVIVVLLAALNVWKWFPANDDSETMQDEKAVVEKSVDLKLPGTIYSIGLTGKAKRDIFNYERNDIAKTTWAEERVNERVVRKPPHPVRAGSTKKTHLGNGLKLAGVLIKEQNRHAFISINGKKLSLSEGDVLNGTYRVSSISELSVELYNLDTKTVFELNL